MKRMKTIKDKFEKLLDQLEKNINPRFSAKEAAMFVIKAGYELAKKEIILEIERRVSVHSFNSDQLRGTSLFQGSNNTKEHYENLLSWIKSEDGNDER